MAFILTSPTFDHRADVPLRHTCSGEDLSPALAWQGAPESTRSFALICLDPDAPHGTFFHWAVFDIPAGQMGLPEGMARSASLKDGMRQAKNDFGRIGYAGPCPPKGQGVHHYHFRLYALDIPNLGLAGGVPCNTVETAVRRHSLGMAELLGLFER